MDAAIRNYFSTQGRKGGLSKSTAKLEAIRANLAKARAKRWPGKPAKATKEAAAA